MQLRIGVDRDVVLQTLGAPVYVSKDDYGADAQNSSRLYYHGIAISFDNDFIDCITINIEESNNFSIVNWECGFPFNDCPLEDFLSFLTDNKINFSKIEGNKKIACYTEGDVFVISCRKLILVESELVPTQEKVVFSLVACSKQRLL
jgi:hypothetical protein